jgi:hypothetical protein
MPTSVYGGPVVVVTLSRDVRVTSDFLLFYNEQRAFQETQHVRSAFTSFKQHSPESLKNAVLGRLACSTAIHTPTQPCPPPTSATLFVPALVTETAFFLLLSLVAVLIRDCYCMVPLLMWHGLRQVEMLLRLVLHLGLLIWLPDWSLIWQLWMMQIWVREPLWVIDVPLRRCV